MGRCSWAGPKAEAEGRNGLALSGFGFGLTWIRGSRLPYPTLANFPASFLSPSRGISVVDFGSLSSFSSLFVVLLSFLGGLKVPKTTDLRMIRKTPFSDLGYRRRRLRKSTKLTLSYCAFIRDPSRSGN